MRSEIPQDQGGIMGGLGEPGAYQIKGSNRIKGTKKFMGDHVNQEEYKVQGDHENQRNNKIKGNQ